MAEETETSWLDTATDWLGNTWDYVTNTGSGGLYDNVTDWFQDSSGNLDISKIAGLTSGIGGVAQAAGWLDGTFLDQNKPTGYQGKVEKKEFVRDRVQDTYDPNRRPGSGGQRYFSQGRFGRGDELPALRERSLTEAQGYEMLNKANPAQEMRSTPAMAQGGQVQGYFNGGRAVVDRFPRMNTATQMPNPNTSNPDNPVFLPATPTGVPGGLSGLAQQYQRTGGNPFNSTGLQTNQTITPEMQARARELARNPMPSAPPSAPRYPAMMMGNTPMTQQRAMGRPPMQAPAQASSRNFDFSSRGRRPYRFADGGIASMAPKGYYLGGTTDGMADKVPATIDQQQPAALSDGEFVVPADVVSHLGNGNSNAGAEKLYGMMDRVRQARTGNKQQGKQINPNKFMPV